MSGNINDTDVYKIRHLVNEFIQDLDNTIKNGDDISNYEDVYKEKYQYIIKTSENLYKMIYNQYQLSNFNKEFFLRNLDIMLKSIEKIQSHQISQYDASKDIGEMLATHYIPQLKK
jgi:hypothetical protein